MTKYQKRPEIVIATQWFRLGDHPAVTAVPHHLSETPGACDCYKPMDEHGYVQTVLVCPGDYVVKAGKSFIVLAAEGFEADYELVREPE